MSYSNESFPDTAVIPEPLEPAPAAEETAGDPVEESADAEERSDAESIVEEPVVTYESDPVLAVAVDQAKAALLEVIPAADIGRHVGHTVEGERVLSLLFETTMRGYPGWRWSVTMARADVDAEPTVLEISLLPIPGEALLSPEWIPWSERLADYRATQAAQALLHDGEDSEDSEDDDDDDDYQDLLHGGDIDGVDVDEADEDSEDSEDDDEDSDDEDSENDSDDDDSEAAAAAEAEPEVADTREPASERPARSNRRSRGRGRGAARGNTAAKPLHATGDEDIYGDIPVDDDDEGPSSYR